MSIKIRLSRGGSKKDAHYSVVVTQSTRKRDGKYIEKIGHYHPCVQQDDKRVVINAERCYHWLSVGAIPTTVVIRLMKKLGLNVPAKYELQINQHKYHGVAKKDVPAFLEKQKQELQAAKETKEAGTTIQEQDNPASQSQNGERTTAPDAEITEQNSEAVHSNETSEPSSTSVKPAALETSTEATTEDTANKSVESTDSANDDDKAPTGQTSSPYTEEENNTNPKDADI